MTQALDEVVALLDLEQLKADELEKIKAGFVELGRKHKTSIDT